MIKKLFIHIILILFTTSVAAEEMFMKCGPTTYKYISDSSGDKIFLRNKYTKNKYEEWCSADKPPPGSILVEDHNVIIKNFKGICIVGRVVYDDGYEIKLNTSVTDFVALTRTREFFDNKNTEKIKQSFKCKKKKK